MTLKASSLFVISYAALSISALAFGFGNQPEKNINTNPLKVESTAVSPVEIPPGKDTELTLYFHLDEGHHAYDDQFKLEVESPTNIFVGEIEVSPLTEFIDPVTKKKKMGAEGHGSIRAQLKLPSSFRTGEHNLNLFLTYQACTKEYCLFPKKIPAQATLKVGRPELMTGDPLAVAMQKGILAAFLLAFFAGILTSFTPCIFPMIPITLAVLGTKDTGRSKMRGLTISLSYVFGIAITYAFLGLAAAKTGALFGSLLGHPLVVTAIAALFVVMALSMYGLFEVKLPDVLANRISNKISGSGGGVYGGAFVSGLLAGVVASPCVGPVLVSILAYVAQTQDSVLGFSLLFVFALGLGQLFILLGTFSQLMQRLPRSGPWLGYVKFVFGTTMIAMALYFVYPVAKPWLSRTFSTEPAVSCPSDPGTSGVPSLTCPADGASGFAKPEWKKYSQSALNEARAAGRPVIIDFKAEWCAACHELEEKTFSDPRVLAQKNLVWLEFDATEGSPELDELKVKYGILGLPFVTFYDGKGEWRKELTLTGFENADAFLERIKKLHY